MVAWQGLSRRMRIGSVLVAVALSVLTTPSSPARADAVPSTEAARCGIWDDPVHHRISPDSQDSLYTTSGREAENSRASDGYTEAGAGEVQGIAFTAAGDPRGGGLSPVFRLLDPERQRHAWTTSQPERAQLRAAGYTVPEGIAFYVSERPDRCLVPVHRLVDTDGTQRLAATETERAALVGRGWQDEGVAFHAAPAVEDTEFTFAVVPDTQNEILGGVNRFTDRTRWLVDQADRLDLRYVTHVGDVVNWDTPDHDQYVRASAATDVLEQARIPIPFSYSIGNHDTQATCEGGSACPGDTKANQLRTEVFNEYFPTTRSTYLAGTFEPGKIDNSFHTFSAGGLDWLVLNLELWPRAEAVEWAKTVLAAHPGHNVAVVTHSHLEGDGSIKQTNGGYGHTSPQYVYDELVSQYANVRFVFSGHTGTTAHRVDTGVHGNPIHQVLTCYHDPANPTRLMSIDTEAESFSTEVYSALGDETFDDGSSFSGTAMDWVR